MVKSPYKKLNQKMAGLNNTKPGSPNSKQKQAKKLIAASLSNPGSLFSQKGKVKKSNKYEISSAIDVDHHHHSIQVNPKNQNLRLKMSDTESESSKIDKMPSPVNVSDLYVGQSVCWNLRIGGNKTNRHGMIMEIGKDPEDAMVKITYSRKDYPEENCQTWVSCKNVKICGGPKE